MSYFLNDTNSGFLQFNAYCMRIHEHKDIYLFHVISVFI